MAKRFGSFLISFAEIRKALDRKAKRNRLFLFFFATLGEEKRPFKNYLRHVQSGQNYSGEDFKEKS